MNDNKKYHANKVSYKIIWMSSSLGTCVISQLKIDES